MFTVFGHLGFYVGSKSSLKEAEDFAVRRSNIMDNESTVKDPEGKMVAKTKRVDIHLWEIERS